MEHLVDWSRAQFALTALYHWLFVPLTLGLTFIVAIMESIYFKTGSEKWKDITKFWMKLLAINFAIGLATGIIMEFEFGTNWSNYSWIVGDIFGAPLAIEGLMAFFMESTFFAVMFFGWEKVSKKAHLLSTWLVAIGSNLSALWILIANGWMQHPVGMRFNPDSARNEMVDFWQLVFNPNAVFKFLHTISSGYVLASLFVVGISSYFLLKKKDSDFAKKSIIVGASFGLISSIYLITTGDSSAYTIAQNQKMKLAAMEGVYKGEKREGIVVAGLLNPDKKIGDDKDTFLFDIKIPYGLSLLGYHRLDGFVAGIDDLVYGNEKMGIESLSSKINKGKKALNALAEYKKSGSKEAMNYFEKHSNVMGYGYFNDPKELVPNVPLTFYSFHIMVGLGSWFLVLFILVLYFSMTSGVEKKKWLLYAGLFTLPLGWVAQETGWIVAEVGRQPWAIQGLLPVKMSTSNIVVSNVMITFWMFAAIFTLLLIADIKIMLSEIKEKKEEL